MISMIDSSIWVDCVRTGSPEPLRRQTKTLIMNPDSVICEPVWFELLRAVPRRDRARTEALLSTVPLLSTPTDLWLTAVTFPRPPLRSSTRLRVELSASRVSSLRSPFTFHLLPLPFAPLRLCVRISLRFFVPFCGYVIAGAQLRRANFETSSNFSANQVFKSD